MSAFGAAGPHLDRRAAPLDLVIFDCDGVLVDSEPIAARVTAAELGALGWPITLAEVDARFLGRTLDDIAQAAAARIGRSLPEGWTARFADHVAHAMQDEAVEVPDAVAAVHATTALGLAWRVASNSSHAEMQAKFRRLGLAHAVAGRLHSYTDVACGKPAPDLFLAAAAAGGAPPSHCLVVEDSLTGIKAAVAAGMDCLALVRHGDGARQLDAGALPFRSMAELPALLRRAMRPPA